MRNPLGRGTRIIGLATFLCGTFGPAAAQVSPAAERRAVDRAEGLARAGRTDEARDVIEDLLDRSPASVEALALLRTISEEDGRFDELLSRAEAAVEAEPSAGRLREIWIGGLVDAGLADSARSVGRRWVASAPTDERAVLSLAGADIADGAPEEAERELRQAIQRGAGTTGIRLLRADLLLAAGDVGAAAELWVSVLGEEDPPLEVILGHLADAPEGSDAVDRLLAALDEPGAPHGPGGLLALRLDRPEAARRLAGRVVGDARSPFLREYVRQSDLAGLPREVAWAAGELVILSPRPIDKVRWRAIVAERSLAAGDTATARGAFAALANESDPGAGPHDAATRRLFGLLAADPARLDEARETLDRYAGQYPDSLHARAEMFGQLSDGYARAGDRTAAERLLAQARSELRGGPVGTAGPIDAAAGRLAFWEGRRDSAVVRVQRSLADPELAASGRTARIEFLTMLQAGDSTEVAVAGAAALELHRDPVGFDPSPALRALAGAPASPGRATVLSYLAKVASEAGRRETAVGIWRRIVDAYPTSVETPAALLGLARHSGGGEPAVWLERLIVGYPESALAPVARRMLAELDGGV